jgi:hypothetical protein
LKILIGSPELHHWHCRLPIFSTLQKYKNSFII